MIQESKHPSFNKLRYSPANLEQLESCYERDRSLQFHYPGSGTVKVPLLRYVHWEFLAHGSHGGRQQLESCYERDRSLQFHYPGSGTVKVPLLRYVHWEFLAHGSHGGRHKSIVVIVSPLEALMLDVAEAFTAMDTLQGTITSIFTVAN